MMFTPRGVIFHVLRDFFQGFEFCKFLLTKATEGGNYNDNKAEISD